MNPIEREAFASVTDLVLKMKKDEHENGKSPQGVFLHVILGKLFALREIVSIEVPKEEANRVWLEYQDTVSVVESSYNCNSSGWSKLLLSIIFLYLEAPEIFRMFDDKIRKTAESVIREKIVQKKRGE